MTYYLEFMAVRASATLRRQPSRIDLARGAFEKFVQLSVATAQSWSPQFVMFRVAAR